MLKRELSKFESYATIIGVMVGAGIFVAIGEAGRDTGPATFLAYLALGPITLLTALPYIFFLSTSLGDQPGGAYLHISRTFKRHFPGFIVMWLKWITYLGVLSIVSLSVGNYIQVFLPNLDARITATVCLLLFYITNLFGVKKYGKLQSIMFVVLVISIILLVVPGLFSVQTTNFTPLLPHGWTGFLKALPILFFAYAGFEALAQTAGETKSASKTLPRVFLIGIIISVIIYMLMSFVVFGTLSYSDLIASKKPVADAAKNFLPFGGQIVGIGAIMAFLTTINACMMVPSRILYIFARDRVAPPILSRLNQRFSTPHISLTINLIISTFLIWTQTTEYLIAIAMQSMVILYATECLALALLPYINKPLWQQVRYKIDKRLVFVGGISGSICLIVLYTFIPNPISIPLLIWITLGSLTYLFTKRKGHREGFDYSGNLSLTTE